MKKRLLLIHPPTAKPGEPPAGIARLKGFLNRHHIPCDLMDANLEGLLFLLNQSTGNDRWTNQAEKQKEKHLVSLRNGNAFKSIDHYNRIIRDLNRLVHMHGKPYGYQLGLADCTHISLSPVRSSDLFACADHPETNPYYDYYISDLLPAIARINPDIIGISLNFLSQAFCTFSLIGLIRSEFPDTEILLGGGLITSWMQNAQWPNPFQGWVDHCVAGPGEPFFIDRFNLSPAGSTFACPDFSGLSCKAYLSPGFILPYNTSIGCYWRKCSFCPECAEGNPYLTIPHLQITEEVACLSEQLNPSLIHFPDNALSPAFLNYWTQNSPGIPWYGYVRFTDSLKDPDFCRQLRMSGCRLLKLGLESGDQDVLDQMRKGIMLSDVSAILKNLKKADISTYIYLLFGTPYEKESGARETMAFTLQHRHEIRFINAAIFNMPVSGEDVQKNQIRPFSEGDLSLYTDFTHPAGWDRVKVRHFLDRVFRRNLLIAHILNRTPKIFTSNHAPFFQ